MGWDFDMVLNAEGHIFILLGVGGWLLENAQQWGLIGEKDGRDPNQRIGISFEVLG